MNLSILFSVIVTTVASTRTISLNNFSNPQPLLVQIKDDKILKQEEGPSVRGRFSCASGNKSSRRMKCSGNSLKYVRETVRSYSMRYNNQVKKVAQYTGWECYGGNKEFEIGFRHDGSFLPLITGCFDEKQQTTLYTTHKISRGTLRTPESAIKPQNWVQGPFFNVSNVNSLYSLDRQRLIINDVLGLESNSTKYINKRYQNYLSRGHLAPEEDFVQASEQAATYHLVNAVPMWQKIDSGNWWTLEKNLRKLVSNRRLDLQIFTGVHKVLRLQHEHSGVFIKLYLSVQGRNRRIPVPEYIWKIAYERESKAGIAFVGVNNPYLEEEFYWYKICRNICFKLNYIKLDPDYGKKGYVYCCEVSELRKRVKTIPNFRVNKLLL